MPLLETLAFYSRPKQESSLTDECAVTKRQVADEDISICSNTSILGKLHLFILGCVLPFGSNKSMGNVICDGSCEEDRLLRNEANLSTQPFHVQLTEVDSAELDTASKRIIEALYEGDDGGLSRTEAQTRAQVFPAGK